MNTEELKQKALKCYGWRNASSAWLHESGDGSAVVGNIDDSHDPAMRNPVAVVDVTHYDGFQDDSMQLAQFYAAANPAAVLELIAEVERVTKQRDELLAALKSYRVARAMPSYGDYASIQWESQQGPTNPQWGGGDCNKHGRWYGHCHCCANDWDKLKKQADQDAVHARDNALRKADSLAVEAISKAEG